MEAEDTDGGEDEQPGHPEVQDEVPGDELPAYEKSLRQRGDVTVWFDEDAVEAWNAASGGRPGGQLKFSDIAIVTALTLGKVFHLPLRQTKGFLASLIRLIGLSLETPDHTTLSRRSRTVDVPRLPKAQSGAIHLVIDSTGLKIVGGGEWHAHTNGLSNKRRRWRKLHLAIDGDGFVVASRLTENSSDDAVTGVEMLEVLGVTVERFTADGAYDTRAMYEAAAALGSPDLKVVIPPKKTAVADPAARGAWRQRNDAVERIALVGRRRWRKESGAHRQARAENGMFRFKAIIGDRLRARTSEAQTTEAMIAVNVLNRMTELGRPESLALGA